MSILETKDRYRKKSRLPYVFGEVVLQFHDFAVLPVSKQHESKKLIQYAIPMATRPLFATVSFRTHGSYPRNRTSLELMERSHAGPDGPMAVGLAAASFQQ